ncbi:hypothetical protein [Novosphingobium sp. JCM 18896]|uniref:hypothetical protein n=1 Tax=Novosphingobium sp. JCM 18896 TaxID=2989731 RepID=UPI002221EF22|nr:hypothetical protein [Novosphingobium sp. JCM 18896]MCW1428073.1 hypothetical protein [Novosphingobium sp. JCM 18896]
MQSIFAPRTGGMLIALISMLLSACLFAPGKFTSTLDLRKDGQFSFAYTGEIHMLALSKLAEEANKAPASFTPETCYKDDTFDERPCTDEDLAKQKQAWEEEQARSAEKRQQDAQSMRAILGGIDPSSPKAAEELAARLRRQAGWKRVDYKGDGLFDVDFAITGRLDHDFTFPTIERFPMANAFVQIAMRNDGSVRVDAPGFAPAAGGEPFRSMMGAKDNMPPPSPVDGTFTLRTDGTILANNTDEGPQPDPAGQKLDWAVNLRTPAAPTALIKLGNP